MYTPTRPEAPLDHESMPPDHGGSGGDVSSLATEILPGLGQRLIEAGVIKTEPLGLADASAVPESREPSLGARLASLHPDTVRPNLAAADARIAKGHPAIFPQSRDGETPLPLQTAPEATDGQDDAAAIGSSEQLVRRYVPGEGWLGGQEPPSRLYLGSRNDEIANTSEAAGTQEPDTGENHRSGQSASDAPQPTGEDSASEQDAEPPTLIDVFGPVQRVLAEGVTDDPEIARQMAFDRALRNNNKPLVDAMLEDARKNNRTSEYKYWVAQRDLNAQGREPEEVSAAWQYMSSELFNENPQLARSTALNEALNRGDEITARRILENAQKFADPEDYERLQRQFQLHTKYAGKYRSSSHPDGEHQDTPPEEFSTVTMDPIDAQDAQSPPAEESVEPVSYQPPLSDATAPQPLVHYGGPATATDLPDHSREADSDTGSLLDTFFPGAVADEWLRDETAATRRSARRQPVAVARTLVDWVPFRKTARDLAREARLVSDERTSRGLSPRRGTGVVRGFARALAQGYSDLFHEPIRTLRLQPTRPSREVRRRLTYV